MLKRNCTNHLKYHIQAELEFIFQKPKTLTLPTPLVSLTLSQGTRLLVNTVQVAISKKFLKTSRLDCFSFNISA